MIRLESGLQRNRQEALRRHLYTEGRSNVTELIGTQAREHMSTVVLLWNDAYQRGSTAHFSSLKLTS